MSTRKVCVDCSAPTHDGNRCPRHQTQFTQRKTIPPATRAAVIRRQMGICAKCHARPITQVDHVIRAERGGTAVARNLQGLCGVCHVKKTNRERGITKEYACAHCGKSQRVRGVCGKCQRRAG